jgi:hypothetical protein
MTNRPSAKTALPLKASLLIFLEVQKHHYTAVVNIKLIL